MQNFNIRYPNLYTTNQRCKCSSIEDTLHILLCSKNTENIQQSLTNIINNTLQQSQLISISDITLLNTLSLLSTNFTNIQLSYTQCCHGTALDNDLDNFGQFWTIK
ncbi:hypothetical protein F8M41_015137 [Gigaspora margarita]|uniref:Uncharacterized protein n=1 Tax=Gigaspora margarita TaxID=4874 RepID=A0A8H4ENC3_GIGMA|nr:hypothetical protein F8M41_015137 [Gigaspora margarita]